jgi:uncharacterized metal-binding protein YceD (DUF177 family)
MLLEFPQHPLCQPDCAGLNQNNEIHDAGEEELKPSAWADLDKLKL